MKEIIARFENGIFKPLTSVNLEENEKVRLKITSKKSVVLATKGMIKGNSEHIKESAESQDILEWNL